ncbi:carbohydrate ABC transporter permease [candidate division WOR-3 bacterium]|nr:carbohydrate ABC transporter permease [candidate division WOR-3 bacterium]
MREESHRKILLILGIIFLLTFCLLPFAWMVCISFSESPDFLVRGNYGFTIKNYIDIVRLKNLHFLDYLKNSLIVSGITAIFSAIIGVLAAYAVSRFNFPGKVVIVVSVLALSMFPQISVVGYLFKLMSNLGWINTYNALIFPYIAFSLPLAFWILLSYFSQIPGEIDEAAMVDGANKFQILFKVILPITLPGFLSAVLLLFMFSFNEFLFALMLTTDFRTRTVPVGIALFQGLHGELPWGYIMAASVVSSIPVILIAIFFQRRIVQGLTRGAVKQ